MLEHPETSNFRSSYAEYVALGPDRVDFKEGEREFNEWLAEVQALAFEQGKAEGRVESLNAKNTVNSPALELPNLFKIANSMNLDHL